MRITIGWAISFVAVVACNRSPSQPVADAAASAPTAASAAVPSAPPAADHGAACEFVTKAEAETILGEHVEFKVDFNGLCEYLDASSLSQKYPSSLVQVELQPGKTKSSFEAMVETADKMLHRTSHRIAGYGEEAFEDTERGDFQLMVYQNGKALSITHGKTKLDPAKYEAFVRKAISRM
jgi:hypothetical protein